MSYAGTALKDIFSATDHEKFVFRLGYPCANLTPSLGSSSSQFSKRYTGKVYIITMSALKILW